MKKQDVNILVTTCIQGKSGKSKIELNDEMIEAIETVQKTGAISHFIKAPIGHYRFSINKENNICVELHNPTWYGVFLEKENKSP